jgi:ribosomal protein S18 acetylase RimI-like enzyme
MSDLSTRLATPDDVTAIARLFDAYRRFYGKERDLPLAARFIRERIESAESILIVAENAQRQIVGFCQLYPSFCSVAAAPICVLYDLFVDPQSRQLGAGRALMLAAEAQAAQRGFVRMDLSTARTNLAAQALYESLGWVRDEAFFVYSRSVER